MSLTLQKMKYRLELEKHDISPNAVARVCTSIDISGSMSGLYENGYVQNTLTRLAAIAMNFDDNKSLDTWIYSNNCIRLPAVTELNYQKFVEQNILSNEDRRYWMGTEFAPFIQDIVKNYYGSEKGIFTKLFDLFKNKKELENTSEDIPVYAIIITDGQNGDRTQTTSLLEEYQKYNIYWQFVGIGYADFSYLKGMAENLPNVGFLEFDNFNLTDEQIYQSLVTDEFVQWIKKHNKDEV